MIELIFAACLSTTPETCENRSIWFIDTTAAECQTGASRQIAKWRAVHPGWDVANWSCDQIEARRAQVSDS